MDNSDLLNYALKRRNFLVAMWLMLQQRWFVRSFNSSARVLSWMVIALGMALVTFTVVTLARNVVPVLTIPGTVPYYLLQSLVLIVSFNIYVNYFCATAFSRRIGRAPVEYVYRDPYAADPAAAPVDDSNTTDSDDESSSAEENTNPAVRVCAARGHTLNGREESSESVGLRDSELGGASRAAAAMTSPAVAPQRFGGIQVVRVFGGNPPTTAPRTSSSSVGSNTNSHNNSKGVGGQAMDGVMEGAVHVPRQRVAISPTTLSLEREMYEMDDEGGESKREAGGRARLLHTSPSSCSTSRSRWAAVFSSSLFFLSHVWRIMRTLSRRFCCGGHTWQRCPCVPRACTSCGPCANSSADTTAATGTASVELLHELERLALAAEKYNPRQRAVRVLDTPRRYCSHCRRLKAPREHHCAICNECVSKMDHHCPWINNCVDVENMRYFILFISWLWLGTLLASAFVGYGVTRQHVYETRREKLYHQWLRAADKTELTHKLQQLAMPYGPSGVLLTSYPTVMVLAVAITMFLCMTLFIYFNRRLVLENTTVIETIYVDEKRKHVYRSTGFQYRNPYDLGAWFNFLDLFTPADDPVVRRELETLRKTGGTTEPATSTLIPSAGVELNRDATTPHNAHRHCDVGSSSSSRKTFVSHVKAAAHRVWVVVWLIGFPTFRPTHSDGVHFITFDGLASGEQNTLFRL